MLVKDVMEYMQSDIKKFSPKTVEVNIHEFVDRTRLRDENDDVVECRRLHDLFDYKNRIEEEINLQIPQNLLNREVDIISITFYAEVAVLYFSICVKEVSSNG